MSKVLFIVPSYDRGGTIISLVNLIEELKKSCSDVSIFAIADQGASKQDFSPQVLLPSNILLSLWFGSYNAVMGIRKIPAFIIKCFRNLFFKLNLNADYWIIKLCANRSSLRGFDTIVAYQEGLATLFTSYIKANRRIAWVHCNLDYSNINSIEYLPAYKRFDKIISVSKYISSVFCRHYPDLTDRADYIYNILDRERIIEKSFLKDEDISLLTNDEKLIVSIGRLSKVKQFSRIPAIAKEVSKKYCNFKWFIIGKGEDEENIIKEINTNNVSSTVKLVGFKSNIAPFMKRASLYVCTSLSEACPMVFMEANALDTFIISTSFPSAIELLTPNSGAITSIDMMAIKIIDCLRDNMRSSVYNDTWFNSTKDKIHSIFE